MRNLEECRAEVFARSEKRIAKRRKIRRRVVAGVTPLCLCIALFMILPRMEPEKNYESLGKPEGNAECTGEPEYGAIGADRQQAIVIGIDGEQWILSETQTEQLTRLLRSYIIDGEWSDSQGEADYEIEIPGEDGSMICYLFSDGYLIYDSLAVHLSDSELQVIFEIIQPESE